MIRNQTRCNFSDHPRAQRCSSSASWGTEGLGDPQEQSFPWLRLQTRKLSRWALKGGLFNGTLVSGGISQQEIGTADKKNKKTKQTNKKKPNQTTKKQKQTNKQKTSDDSHHVLQVSA